MCFLKGGKLAEKGKVEPFPGLLLQQKGKTLFVANVQDLEKSIYGYCIGDWLDSKSYEIVTVKQNKFYFFVCL